DRRGLSVGPVSDLLGRLLGPADAGGAQAGNRDLTGSGAAGRSGRSRGGSRARRGWRPGPAAGGSGATGARAGPAASAAVTRDEPGVRDSSPLPPYLSGPAHSRPARLRSNPQRASDQTGMVETRRPIEELQALREVGVEAPGVGPAPRRDEDRRPVVPEGEAAPRERLDDEHAGAAAGARKQSPEQT